jgi:hypothetical protein
MCRALSLLAVLLVPVPGPSGRGAPFHELVRERARGQPPEEETKAPDEILLKDHRPVSLHKVPVTTVAKARYPAIDMHSHPWVKTPEEVDRWVKVMDEVGVEKSVLLTQAHGEVGRKPRTPGT